MNRLLMYLVVSIAFLLISTRGYGSVVSGSITFTFVTNQVSPTLHTGSWRAVVISPDGTRADGPVININDPSTTFTITISPSIETGAVYTVVFQNISITGLICDLIFSLTATSSLIPTEDVVMKVTLGPSNPNVSWQFHYVPYPP